MGGKLRVSVFGLVVALSCMDIGAANAAKVRPGASPSREQLMVYCRYKIFAKYGVPGRFGKRWLQDRWFWNRVDYCVASGGKSI
jgi:hypothetical protein